MQNTQNAHAVVSDIVDQDVILMSDEFAGIGHTTRAAKAGMVGEPLGTVREPLIEGQCSGRVILSDVFANRLSVAACRTRPDEPHIAALSLRCISARHVAASDSTSSDESTSPALAESSPTFT